MKAIDETLEPTLTNSSLPLFANFDAVPRSWYVAAKSKQVSRCQVRSFDLLNRRFALWRDAKGVVHALDAQCPHLGADLGQGQVLGDRLRCAFHHWSFDGSGRCVHAPGHEEAPHHVGRAYPVAERFGLIWLFNGQDPTFHVPSLPDGDDEGQFWKLLPPSKRISCHPHLVIGNGLDASHFETVHDMRFTATPTLEQTGQRRLTLRIQGRPRSRLVGVLTGSGKRDIRARFTTIGGNLAWSTVESPIRFHTLFTARPSAGHCCETQIVLFLPRGGGLGAIRAIMLTYALLHDDSRILERLDFHPGFTDADAPLRQFAELVNQMERE